jgi:hypothetical protein
MAVPAGTDHYRGRPAILIRMDAVKDNALSTRLEAAWRVQEPEAGQGMAAGGNE